MLRMLSLCAMLALTGCQSAYYATMEKFGIEKRDILVDRVEDAKDAQQDAQQEFRSALEQFSALINFDGGELQSVYQQLNDEYESSLAAAERVTARIDSVESVAEALFDEWQDELDEYSNSKLRRESQRQLDLTQRKYQSLLNSMRVAESKMQPVLDALQDNVLYLKHNLNASAIGALQGELGNIRNDVEQLIGDMNSAIEASDRFIADMQAE